MSHVSRQRRSGWGSVPAGTWCRTSTRSTRGWSRISKNAVLKSVFTVSTTTDDCSRRHRHLPSEPPVLIPRWKNIERLGFVHRWFIEILNWLQSIKMEYDSSCFDVDPFQAAPGGVGTVSGRSSLAVSWSCLTRCRRTIHCSSGWASRTIASGKTNWIILIRYHGMASMLTHPDYLTGRRESDIYFDFLRHVKDMREHWHATPTEVSRWWRNVNRRGVRFEHAISWAGIVRKRIAF